MAATSAPQIAQVVRDYCKEFGYQMTPFQMNPTTIAYSSLHSEAMSWKLKKEKAEKKEKKEAKTKFSTYESHPLVLLMKDINGIMDDHRVAVDTMAPKASKSIVALFESKMHKSDSNPDGRVSHKFAKFRSNHLHLLVHPTDESKYVLVACVGSRRVVVYTGGKYEVFSTKVANVFLTGDESSKVRDFVGSPLAGITFSKYAFIATKKGVKPATVAVKDEE